MRAVSGAVGVLLLLALLTWLLLRGIDTSTSGYEATLRAFDSFELAEASLHRDVLQARAGLLRDYDTLGRSTEAMEDAVDGKPEMTDTELREVSRQFSAYMSAKRQIKALAVKRKARIFWPKTRRRTASRNSPTAGSAARARCSMRSRLRFAAIDRTRLRSGRRSASEPP